MKRLFKKALKTDFCLVMVILVMTTGYGFARTDIRIAQKQYELPVLTQKANNPVLQIHIHIPENSGEQVLEELLLNVDGTTDISDVKAIRAYYYGKDAMPGNMQHVRAGLFGAANDVNGRIQIAGNQKLHEGDNYVWISYELYDRADLMNRVGANCLRVKINGDAISPATKTGVAQQRIGVAVRQHNQDFVHTSRIPGMATTNKGTLLAVFDARYESARDLQGHMDIGLNRSTDGGQTWEPLQITMDMGEWGGLPQRFNGVSDACILVDKNSDAIYIAGLWMHGVINEHGEWVQGLDEHSEEWNHQWRNKGSQPGFGVKETSQFLIVKSTDDGLTWSDPVNITEMGKREEWWLWAPAPGQGITLDDGTLVLPTQGRDRTGKSFSNITYSQDGGATWHSTAPALLNTPSGTTECAVVQLSDGSLMLNMRANGNRGNTGSNNGRAIAVTHDLGKTWVEHPTSFSALPEPTCMASLHKHVFNMHGDNQSALIFANPNSKTHRENITLKMSSDDGATWPERYWILLDEWRGRGYSCITSVGKEYIGILYESSQADMVFQKIHVNEFVGKR